MLEVANSFAQGSGVKKSWKKAFAWLEKASSHDDSNIAQSAKDRIKSFLSMNKEAAAFAPLLGPVTLQTCDELDGLKCTLVQIT